MDIKEYNCAKEKVAEWVFCIFDEQRFTLKDFKCCFSEVEEELKISVETDRISNKFPEDMDMTIVPSQALFTGGWRFIDWDDRVRSFLKTKVKKGILSEERADGKLYYKVRKEV